MKVIYFVFKKMWLNADKSYLRKFTARIRNIRFYAVGSNQWDCAP